MALKKFSLYQKALHYLVLHSYDDVIPLGLKDGKSGISLVLAHIAKVNQLPELSQVSNDLFSYVIRNLDNNMSYEFDSGLSGIGWCIEYLIQEGYAQGDSADICTEIDDKIMEYDLFRIAHNNSDAKFRGLLHYIYAHVQGANKSQITVFDRDYMSNLLNILERKCKCNLFWSHDVDLSNKLLDGSTNVYKFSLTPFINPHLKITFNKLGLYDGLAGFLELYLNTHDDEYIYSR